MKTLRTRGQEPALPSYSYRFLFSGSSRSFQSRKTPGETAERNVKNPRVGMGGLEGKVASVNEEFEDSEGGTLG